MISRNLFSKLLKEDLKRRIWTIALATLVFFLFLPVICAITLGNYGDGVSREYIIDEITNLLYPQSTLLIFITLAGAVICGLSSFFYLHSRKKVDLYHSIPVRRETLFSIYYLNGIFIYVVTYAINLFLCFVILLINGFMSLSILGIALSAFAVNLLFYCLVYTLTVIAVMLTGNFIISCFGTGVFLFYGPMVTLLKEMYYHDFFSTYYDEDIWYTNFQFLSPIGSYVDVVQRVDTVLNKDALGKILTVLVVTLLLIAFALFLYKKRPSEAAGKAMAFSISKPIIKFLLVVPITLGGGIIFREISYKGSDGWFLFGLLFSFFLSYAIIEIIYNFDIRCAFCHKKHIAVSALLVLIIAGIFRFDIFKYDLYLPEENKIESMSVAITGLDENISYYRSDSEYYNSREYQLKKMKLTNFTSAYDLAKVGIESIDTDELSERTFTYYVKYNLKNGQKVYRSYTVDANDNYDKLKEIYESKEFKEGHYPTYNLSAKDIKFVTCYNFIDSKSFSLNNEEKQQLLEIYKEDLNHITLDELKESTTLATIVFQFYDSSNDAEYYVYPSFTNTMEFLKEHGFNIDSEGDVNRIQEIQIIDNTIVNNDSKKSYSSMDTSSTITITDKAQIKEIYAGLISAESFWNNQTIIDANTTLDVSVIFTQDNYGNQAVNQYYFKEGKIPDFVKTALSVYEN